MCSMEGVMFSLGSHLHPRTPEYRGLMVKDTVFSLSELGSVPQLRNLITFKIQGHRVTLKYTRFCSTGSSTM